MSKFEKLRATFFTLLVVLLVIIYIRGLWIPLMHNDSAHHANIALHMHNTGDYVSLIDREGDYLDKPHFLFWSAALAFKILGISPFAFKITSFFFGILCVYSTYHLARFLYTSDVGILSVVILATSYSFMLAFNDVRMEAILTGAITFSIWQLILLCTNSKVVHAVYASLGMAIAFSTKGAIGIVMPSVAAIIYLIQHNAMHKLFSSRWLVTALITLLLVSPVLYCYYLQFDLHPEKNIRGYSEISGVSFILFGQTLERLGHESNLAVSKGDPFFYVHTFLWAFLPWTVIGIAAWTNVLRRGWQMKFSEIKSDALLFLFISIMLIMISIVSSKLPHYLTILFPFISILTASFILQSKSANKTIRITQQVVILILLLLAWILSFYFFPIRAVFTTICVIILSMVVLIFLFLKIPKKPERVVLMTSSAAILLFFVLNFHFYPAILKFQGGKVLAEKIIDLDIPINQIAYINDSETANDFDFYLKRNVPYVSMSDIKCRNDTMYIVCGDTGYQELKSQNISTEEISRAKDFKVSKLKFRFLNPVTRESVLENLYLLKVK